MENPIDFIGRSERIRTFDPLHPIQLNVELYWSGLESVGVISY